MGKYLPLFGDRKYQIASQFVESVEQDSFWGHSFKHWNKTSEWIKEYFESHTNKYHGVFVGMDDIAVKKFLAVLLAKNWRTFAEEAARQRGFRFSIYMDIKTVQKTVSDTGIPETKIILYNRKLEKLPVKRLIFICERASNPVGIRLYSVYPDSGEPSYEERMAEKRAFREAWDRFVK